MPKSAIPVLAALTLAVACSGGDKKAKSDELRPDQRQAAPADETTSADQVPQGTVSLDEALRELSKQQTRAPEARGNTGEQPNEDVVPEGEAPQGRTIILIPVPQQAPGAEGETPEDVVPAPDQGEANPPDATILLIPAQPEGGAAGDEQLGTQQDVVPGPAQPREEEEPNAAESGRFDGSQTGGELIPDSSTGGERSETEIPRATPTPEQDESAPLGAGPDIEAPGPNIERSQPDEAPAETRVPDEAQPPATAPTDEESIFF